MKPKSTLNNCLSDNIVSNKLKSVFKNGKLIIQNVEESCPQCHGNDVIKYGYTNRTLKFYNKNHETFNLQRYKCNYYGKTFQTDFRSVVKDNANITNELKDHIVTQFQEAHARIRPIINSITKMGGNIFCKQSVHNILGEINHRIQKQFRNNSKIPKNNKVLDKALNIGCIMFLKYQFHIFFTYFNCIFLKERQFF